jgi:hypothetical protein
MLRSLRILSGFRIRAADGGLGQPKNWLFDDAQWAVRYLVLEAGFWPARHRVLVGPLAFGRIDEPAWLLCLDGTRKDLQDGSPLAMEGDGAAPREQEHSRRLGWLWHDGAGFMSRAGIETAQDDLGAVTRHYHDPHLRSWRDALGCRIRAGNAEIGRITDFIAEDHDWTILYLVVDTGHSWAGKKLLVLPDWIETVNWEDGVAQVNVARQLICDAPQFIPSLLAKRDYQEELFGIYYGQAP